VARRGAVQDLNMYEVFPNSWTLVVQAVTTRETFPAFGFYSRTVRHYLHSYAFRNAVYQGKRPRKLNREFSFGATSNRIAPARDLRVGPAQVIVCLRDERWWRLAKGLRG
jgi:hypothetical protein